MVVRRKHICPQKPLVSPAVNLLLGLGSVKETGGRDGGGGSIVGRGISIRIPQRPPPRKRPTCLQAPCQPVLPGEGSCLLVLPEPSLWSGCRSDSLPWRRLRAAAQTSSHRGAQIGELLPGGGELPPPLALHPRPTPTVTPACSWGKRVSPVCSAVRCSLEGGQHPHLGDALAGSRLLQQVPPYPHRSLGEALQTGRSPEEGLCGPVGSHISSSRPQSPGSGVTAFTCLALPCRSPAGLAVQTASRCHTGRSHCLVSPRGLRFASRQEVLRRPWQVLLMESGAQSPLRPPSPAASPGHRTVSLWSTPRSSRSNRPRKQPLTLRQKPQLPFLSSRPAGFICRFSRKGGTKCPLTDMSPALACAAQR